MSSKILTVVIPDKPGQPVVEVVGTSVRLEWRKPHSDGGADITQYNFICSSPDSPEYVTIPSDANTESLISYTIRNQLQPHTEYTFAVAAVNRVGQGPWSDWTESTWTFAGMSEHSFHLVHTRTHKHTTTTKKQKKQGLY